MWDRLTDWRIIAKRRERGRERERERERESQARTGVTNQPSCAKKLTASRKKMKKGRANLWLIERSQNSAFFIRISYMSEVSHFSNLTRYLYRLDYVHFLPRSPFMKSLMPFRCSACVSSVLLSRIDRGGENDLLTNWIQDTLYIRSIRRLVDHTYLYSAGTLSWWKTGSFMMTEAGIK